MSKLKVAVVGTGNVAQKNYLPFLSRDAEVSLGYYSRTAAKAQTCADQFGGQTFASVAELMDWAPDTALVLTRETQRLEAALALLEHTPRRIFFEKPLVARRGQEQVDEQDFADGRDILRRAKAIHCETAMVFNYRFFDHSQLARRVAAERDFGQVLEVTGLVHYACWSHAIDLIHFFAGPIAQISALSSKSIREGKSMKVEDVAAAFRTKGDAAGTLIGTAALAWEFPLFELSLNFERGHIRLQDLDGDLEIMDARGEVERYGIPRHRSRWDQYNQSFEKSLAAYLDSIRTNQPPPVPGRFGLLELQVEAGLKRSIAQQRPVVLDAEFPLD
ncbi:MAG: Gfo/Idh/MocA family oxidoreductase [Candidatus Latescibacteria bacterium]|nr:Gfo/Idh/MocA family oxidoreductase [Candidatus Latescibacterota bacterium]